MDKNGAIGVFDSGFGGLSVLKYLTDALPDYDYLYLGDNARAPYGTRTFDEVYQYTLQAVKYLFEQDCPLVILACNTASAKALRTIQQQWLPTSPWPGNRVLGVIRPTAEAVGKASKNGHIGVLATPGTIASGSYEIEIAKLNPTFTVTGHACPMWVPLVEYGYASSDGADFFVDNDIDAIMGMDGDIDTLVLACTHYPHLLPKIRQAVKRCNTPVNILTQGRLVADSLADYLVRHPEIANRLKRNGLRTYHTTGSTQHFDTTAHSLLGLDAQSQHIVL